MLAQLPEVLRAEVGQLVLLPVRPQILDRIQFRRIAGKKLHPQAPALLSDELPGCAAAMTRQSIPDDQQPAGNVAQEMREKLDDLRAADGTGKQPKVKVPPGYAGHRRQHLPVEVILQHRRLSPWRPGAAAVRALAQSAFVDEDDGAPLFLGFFLISGQRCCFHCRIFSSSRSSARPTGRWQLQPSCRRIRQACEGWYFTPHSCSIRWATRHEVHRLVSYPKACGPRFRPRSMRPKSSRRKRALRPARPACFSARSPPCFSCPSQRLTDCRCTPTCRATSAGCIPWRNSRAPNNRRSSNFWKSRRTPAGFPITAA